MVLRAMAGMHGKMGCNEHSEPGDRSKTIIMYAAGLVGLGILIVSKFTAAAANFRARPLDAGGRGFSLCWACAFPRSHCW